MTDSDYDDFAEAYARQNETGLFNAYYEQPAMLRLAGDVRGRRILDVGCGSGPTIAKLRAAKVASSWPGSMHFSLPWPRTSSMTALTFCCWLRPLAKAPSETRSARI